RGRRADRPAATGDDGASHRHAGSRSATAAVERRALPARPADRAARCRTAASRLDRRRTLNEDDRARDGPGLPGWIMRYRRLGRTALQVSELCLGTMNFGPQTPEDESFAIMDRALELGINFFDTANRYGRGKGARGTEPVIARWFAQGGGRA